MLQFQRNLMMLITKVFTAGTQNVIYRQHNITVEYQKVGREF